MCTSSIGLSVLVLEGPRLILWCLAFTHGSLESSQRVARRLKSFAELDAVHQLVTPADALAHSASFQNSQLGLRDIRALFRATKAPSAEQATYARTPPSISTSRKVFGCRPDLSAA